MNYPKYSYLYLTVLFAFASVLFTGCHKPANLNSVAIETNYKTENVFVVVIDGPRYSETWGDPTHSLIPNMHNTLAGKGIINQEFYNLGTTHTMPGHTAVATGTYEDISNTGRQYPSNPSFLQHWLYQTQNAPAKAWVVGSKKKLQVLSNCSSVSWRNSYLPSVNTVDRLDKETFKEVKKIISTHHPKLMLINLKGPDFWGHGDDWFMYKYGIRQTDSMLNALVTIIETDSVYAGKTSLIMTNDHGRHLEGMQNGFVSHGDKCLGCTHINFYAYGPDFKSGVILNNQRHLIDVAPTVAELLGFKMEQVKGDIMTELFKE